MGKKLKIITFGKNTLNDLENRKLSNPEYFEFLFKEYYPLLFNTLFKLTGSKELTEDIIQETFINIWQNAHKIKVKTSIKSYIFGAAINNALTRLKKEKTNINIDYPAEDDNMFIISSNDDPADQIHYLETRKKVRKAVNNLPPACKAIFIMARHDNMSYKEIASIMNISVKTVDNQLWKAMKILKEELKELLSTVTFILLLIYNFLF